MQRGAVLILEDDEERVWHFKRAINEISSELTPRFWRSANVMIQECDQFLDDACLISLDHDLNKAEGEQADPGDGLLVATFLAEYPRICPLILHSTNVERVWSMHNELRFAGWEPARVGPIGADWIAQVWKPKALSLIEGGRRIPPFRNRPHDHAERMRRASLALEGLSVGDAFGEQFFTYQNLIPDRITPPPPWFVTDDTMMALSVVDVLERFGEIKPDALAKLFARRYQEDPRRGYGGMAHSILRQLGEGQHWSRVAQAAFDGEGSMGNGGAMRVAPVGAYYADDVEKAAKNGASSAMVTHAHPDGQAGAIATAVATAWAANTNNNHSPVREMIECALQFTPPGATRRGIERASGIPPEADPSAVASILGSGNRVISSDTVPFVLWCAMRHLDNYADALWTTVSGLGDRDTTAAMVGGIVAGRVGIDGIPKDWIASREHLLDL